MKPNWDYIDVSYKWGITNKYVFLPDVITFKDTMSSEILYTISVLYHNLWPMNRSKVETNLADKTILFSVYTTIWILRDV